MSRDATPRPPRRKAATKPDRRAQILDAATQLISEGRGGAATISEITERAGIGKGSAYYYFDSKEAIFDALLERAYDPVVTQTAAVVDTFEGPAVAGIQLLMGTYAQHRVDDRLDDALHRPENAHLHQKSLVRIIQGIAPVLERQIRRGISEGTMTCPAPRETAEALLAALAFLLDPGVFPWTDAERVARLLAISHMAERALGLPPGALTEPAPPAST